MIHVTVLVFAGIRDGIGKDKLHLSFPTKATLNTLIQHMHQQYPALSNHFLSSQFIVNCAIIDLDYILKDQDEIAILPPLGGG
jgi:MoaE-MoaD fusion protein